MRKIPEKLKQEMVADDFYKQSCLSGKKAERIEWHHNLIFAGRQQNVKWAILPLTQEEHRDIVKHRQRCDWIMINRANLRQLIEYSKAENLLIKKGKLNSKFGEWTPDWYKTNDIII